ncbi:Uncharacterized protein QTN25_008766 [Entamoeba marina]
MQPSFLLIALLIALCSAECSERKLRKLPIVFKDCEKSYDNCDCLKRKEFYLNDSDCVESDEYKAISQQLIENNCDQPRGDVCTYKKDYECRIIHSGCLDVVTLGLGGNKTHCLEKFVECLDRAHCQTTPFYQQATNILNNKEEFSEKLEFNTDKKEL